MSRIKHERCRGGDSFKRKRPEKRPYDRILIVCEGEKTEPNYLEEIRRQHRLPSADIRIIGSALGTEPLQIVEAAVEEFKRTRAFERIYVVFDRDEHRTYHTALAKAPTLNKHLRNDERVLVHFNCIPSVPCFELWLLLHFEDVQNFTHRDDLISRIGRHIPRYQKGSTGIYAITEPNLETATHRAVRLRERFTSKTGTDPVTDMDLLVGALRAIRV